MGLVYKITLPDGRFYIGHTRVELELRIFQHLRKENSSYRYGIFVKEFNLTRDNIMDYVTILHDCWDSEFYEISVIYRHRKNELLLNKRVRKSKPSYSSWYDSYNPEPICNISKGAYLEFNELCTKLGLSNDIFMKKLIKNLNKKEYPNMYKDEKK